MAYRRRVIDHVLDDLFPHLAAIALEGAKGVGKTATAMQRAATAIDFADPAQRATVSAHLDGITEVPTPVFIDEWQLEPPVWDRVRRAVDDDRTGGQFLLAGSANVAPGMRIHSGAGRIVRMRMRPLAMSERGIIEPTVSLGKLLAGDHEAINGRDSVKLPTYVDEILRSGFPGIRDLPERARNTQLASYVTQIVERELPENGIAVRRPSVLLDWLKAYGAVTSTDASYSVVLDAATADYDDKPNRATVDIYREYLTRLFVLDPVPAWSPIFSPIKRLTHTPKHHLVDPALAARMTGIGKSGLLNGEGVTSASTGIWLGALFESLATQSIRVYAMASDASVGHLRTKDTTREIDLVVEGTDRRVVAIEVKLAGTVSDKDVRHLNWLRQNLGDRVADRLIVTTGPHAYRRPDGVGVVPLALLGP